MRKLFLSLIITLGAFAAPNLWAEGDLRPNASNEKVGKSLTTQGRFKDLKTYLENIIGATLTIDGTDTTAVMSSSVKPTSSKGDVYFVEVNDFWKGNQTTGDNIYQTINKGVNKIEMVDPDKKQTTSTGVFYPYQAENTNKFFFIVRRDSYYSSYSDYPLNFRRWYDEWSYVDVTGNNTPGYSDLKECYSKLADGAPFFAPHNCNNSLEINHYITLNDPNSDKPTKYSFTAYLYIPETVDTDYSTVYEYNEAGTFYIYPRSKYPDGASRVSSATSYYIKNSDGTYSKISNSTYADSYSRYTTKPVDGYTPTYTVPVYARTNKKIYNDVPYVFFYRIKLGKIDEASSIKSTLNPPATTPSESDMKCHYTVDLDWGTSFDRFRSQLTATSYDTMKEHFIIQRSYDKTNWKTIGIKDLEGNKVKNNVADYTKGTSNAADYKVFTDNTLPDFNETTKKIGYTVYYRIVSEVRKSDDTVMSTTTSNDIQVDIPGTTPFKLTLEAGNTSDYQHGSMDGENYIEGNNTFVNTLTAAKAVSETVVTLAEGVRLELVRTTYDKDGNKTKENVGEPAVCTSTTNLDDLIAKIGTREDRVTTDAGEKYDAQYQLVLTYNDGTTTESNIVKIVNSKVSNTSVSVHRSGTPDAATCAETELFRNEVKFKPQMSAVPGAGYYIYCNGEKVLTLEDKTNNKDFKDDNGTMYTVDANGYITMTFFAEHAPIAKGETGTGTSTDFHYAVVHFDPIVNGHSNTYGSEAKASSYSGAKGELVVTFSTTTSTLGSHYDLVFIRPVLNWTLDKTEYGDVASPNRYEIYMKMEQAEFEKKGEDSSGRKGNVTDWEGDNFGKYLLRTTIKRDQSGKLSTSFADEIYYARRKQSSGTWVNPIADDEIRPVSYYVRAIYSEDAYEEAKRNVAEKNSDVFAVKASAGGIFTAIDDVAAEGVSVEANDGVITVAGASGTIVVYSATGQAVATAQGDGGETTIDASNLSGVYIVKANNMKPTKILIK